MELKRKIYRRLQEWKAETNGSKALLVEGARRIGKSTVCRIFAKNEYQSYILIDFSKASETVKNCFTNHLNDLDTFFMILSNEYNVTLYRRGSIFIFDEVQLFPKAREAIKHLVADGRYDYLETGSLISIRENVEDILIPSEERKISMYPLDFEEFLMALGNETMIGYIRECFEKRMPLEQGLHEKAMLLFKQYLLVGGMPQSVVAFLENDRSFEKADVEKREILALYRDDIMKIKSPYRGKVINIFDQMPGLLSRHDRRVVFKEIAPGSYAEKYEDTFFWLSNSMIANDCFLCNDPEVGLSVNENRTYVKCYMGDTGLLISHSFDENELLEEEVYKQILNDRLSINEGMFYENAVAQMLVANGHKLYFYTHYSDVKHRNDIEIDFLISNHSKLKYKMFPIEVKSSRRYQVKSLERFMEKYRRRIGTGYVIHPRNLTEREDGILCVPPYMTMFL